MSEDIYKKILDWAKTLEKARKSELDARRDEDNKRGERERKSGDPLPYCEKCKGTGRVSCRRCSGTGEDICFICNGSGWTFVGIPPQMMLCSCQKGKVGCVACNRKGTEPCACTLAER